MSPALVFLVAVASKCLMSGSASPPASLAESQLKTRLVRQQNRIDSLYIVYEARGYGAAYPKGTYLHREIAAKRPCSFYYVSAHGFDVLNWRHDPLMRRIYIVGQHKIIENPVNRAYGEFLVEKDGVLPSKAAGDFVLTWLGLWPMTDWSSPQIGMGPVVLKEVALSDEYKLRSTQEIIDDRWCDVVTRDNLDTLWFDTERDCTLMAREIRDPITRQVLQSVRMGGHKDIGRGVWIPMSLKFSIFSGANSDELKEPKPIQRGTVTILHASINQIDDRMFRFVKKPGTILESNDRSIRQVVDGGHDHLQVMASWIKEQCVVESHVTSQSLWLLLLQGVLFGGGLCGTIGIGRTIMERLNASGLVEMN